MERVNQALVPQVKRPQSIREFAEAAGLEIPEPVKEEPEKATGGDAKEERPFRKKLLVTLGLSLLGVAVLAALLFFLLK